MSFHFPIINEKLLANKIMVNRWKREKEYFMDWILSDNFKKRTNSVVENKTICMTYGECLNKGTLTTLTYALENTARTYLNEKGMGWHHAMKKLLPDIYFTHTFLEAVEIKDKRIILELVAMAADYIYMHYKVAEYDSRIIDK